MLIRIKVFGGCVAPPECRFCEENTPWRSILFAGFMGYGRSPPTTLAKPCKIRTFFGFHSVLC